MTTPAGFTDLTDLTPDQVTAFGEAALAAIREGATPSEAAAVGRKAAGKVGPAFVCDSCDERMPGKPAASPSVHQTDGTPVDLDICSACYHGH